MVRQVRLKEYEPNKTKVRYPDQKEVDGYNGTIESKKYLFSADENGFIRSKNVIKDDSVEKIILLGDSFFECSFIDDGDRLCDVLNKEAIRNDTAIEFINSGYAACTTLNLLISFVAKILPMRPSAIICKRSLRCTCFLA